MYVYTCTYICIRVYIHEYTYIYNSNIKIHHMVHLYTTIERINYRNTLYAYTLIYKCGIFNRSKYTDQKSS